MLNTLWDLTLVVIGFGLIVFVHELGHFIAARWAKIRVLAFALGFGPALLSYRKGLGLRRGSSEPELVQLYEDAASDDSSVRAAAKQRLSTLSPTEYRVNILPFGGYVKMLGQDDLDPGFVSHEGDSYQRCKPWKRMVVISAGVIMNIITAALLFMIVFLVGLKVEPPIVGGVVPGSPAARAAPIHGPDVGVTALGLLPGDEITKINGRRPNSFADLTVATAMAGPGDPVMLVVRRPGIEQPLQFSVMPEKGRISGLLEMGVEPSRSTTVTLLKTPEDRAAFAAVLGGLGLQGVESGMRLVEVNGLPATDGLSVSRAARESTGQPLRLTFESPDGSRLTREISPRAALRIDRVPGTIAGSSMVIEHLAGLTPVMAVGPLDEEDRGYQMGLRTDDIFARLGSIEFPSVPQGMAQIRAHAGRTIPVVVLRKNAEGAWKEVTLPDVSVTRKGLVGFGVSDSGEETSLVALPPAAVLGPGDVPSPTSAATLITLPGTRIIAVGETPVGTFAQLREALRAATSPTLVQGGTASVEITLQRPSAAGTAEAPHQTTRWTLSHADVHALHELSWESPLGPGVFEPAQVMLRAEGPLAAVAMGLSETRRVMLMTYITFARLFQGTVKVEQLRGPVGIAHAGTIVAGKGFVWLLFFLALISVNLAVVNFLPLPIVDGGQFLFILWEQLRGQPPPIAVQNFATFVGLALIGTMFVVVTFNDIRNLLGL